MHTLRKMQRKGVVNGVDDALKCLGFTSSRGPPFVTTMACPLGVFHSGLLFFSAWVLRHKKKQAFTAKLLAPLNAARVLAFLKWFWLRF